MEAVQDISLWTEVVMLGTLLFVGNVSQVVSGLGLAMIFTVGWNLGGIAGWCSGRVMEVAIYTLIPTAVACPIQAIILRKHCNVGFVVLVSICWVGAEALGTHLMSNYEGSPWFKRALGVVLLVIFFVETVNQFTASVAAFIDGKKPVSSKASETSVLAKGSESFTLSSKRNIIWSVGLGLGAGFMRGLFNVPLMALLVFALHSGMPKDEWRGNLAGVVCIVIIPKAYFVFVVLDEFTADKWPQYVTAIVVSLASIPLGNIIAARVDQVTFRHFILVILFFGSLVLATNGTGLISIYVIAALAGLGFLVLLGSKCRDLCLCAKHVDQSDSSVLGAVSNDPPTVLIGRELPADAVVDPELAGASPSLKALRNRAAAV